MYMVDRVERSSFFYLLARIETARDEMKRKEVVFKPLVQKWRERSNAITLMYISIIILTCHQVEKVFDLLNKLQDFDDK